MAKVLIKVVIDDEEYGNRNIQELVLETLHDQCIYPSSIESETVEN